MFLKLVKGVDRALAPWTNTAESRPGPRENKGVRAEMFLNGIKGSIKGVIKGLEERNQGVRVLEPC